ncbi:hypothetical protein [Nocardiopsis trehalosi]|uniref:hypothetical protein n=1 Tax=Nocardiopsis trehalosi TaxID=109329 RepID=UPI000829CF75|nr:hypothetical protein [Nocardiopsis trehalosi]
MPTMAPGLVELIRPHTGPVTAARSAGGHSSDLAAIVEAEQGRFFVKAMKNRPGGRRDSLTRERLIAPHLAGVAPALLWHAEDDAWLALGFEVVEGRHPDITPGSPDLPVVADLIDRIGHLPLPDVARDWPETRWDRFTSEADAALFAGETLLYTDIHPSNIIIGTSGVWAVDWAWPTRGAAFIDPAILVVQLVAAGHPPADAEDWASRCAAWVKADSVAVDAFAAASVRMHTAFAEKRPYAAWLRAMADAATEWAGHRGVDV